MLTLSIIMVSPTLVLPSLKRKPLYDKHELQTQIYRSTFS